jgi:hypothetical protein
MIQHAGTPDYPTGIPDMHIIHDPMISVVNPHIRVDTRITSSITVPNNRLTIGHMTKFDITMQGKFTIKQRILNSVDDPHHAYYPTGN